MEYVKIVDAATRTSFCGWLLEKLVERSRIECLVKLESKTSLIMHFIKDARLE